MAANIAILVRRGLGQVRHCASPAPLASMQQQAGRSKIACSGRAAHREEQEGRECCACPVKSDGQQPVKEGCPAGVGACWPCGLLHLFLSQVGVASGHQARGGKRYCTAHMYVRQMTGVTGVDQKSHQPVNQTS
jgi:hypothetical protein